MLLWHASMRLRHMMQSQVAIQVALPNRQDGQQEGHQKGQQKGLQKYKDPESSPLVCRGRTTHAH
jgi:predicted transposase YdaD